MSAAFPILAQQPPWTVLAVGADTSAVVEQERLDALRSYDVLDTPPEESFDKLTRLARRLFDVPISMISFIDGHRLWCKSRQGLADQEVEREFALCHFAMAEPGMLVVRDTSTDDRFSSNPFVTGDPHIRFYAGVALRTPDGHSLGTLCVIDRKPREFGPADMESLSDLGSLVTSVLELRQHVATDALTGALSRRAFRAEAEKAVARARAHRQGLSCLMVDLDHFKAINGTHGHAGGDRVLAASVTALRSGLRESDVIGRLGGEEFAVLFPMTELPDALEAAERMRAAIAGAVIEMSTGAVTITASFGLAPFDQSIADVDDLLARADEALLRAKVEGRNRVALCGRPFAPLAPRPRVLKAGTILLDSGGSTIDCTVVSLSDAEARLDVIGTATVPDEFRLVIESDNLSRACRVSSRRDRHLEVVFA